MRGSKIPVQELWLKMGGGRNSGILRIRYKRSVLIIGRAKVRQVALYL